MLALSTNTLYVTIYTTTLIIDKLTTTTQFARKNFAATVKACKPIMQVGNTKNTDGQEKGISEDLYIIPISLIDYQKSGIISLLIDQK